MPSREEVEEFIRLQEEQAQNVAAFLEIASETIKTQFPAAEWVKNVDAFQRDESRESELYEAYEAVIKRGKIARATSTRSMRIYNETFDHLSSQEEQAARAITLLEDRIEDICPNAYRQVLGVEGYNSLRHDDVHQLDDLSDVMKFLIVPGMEDVDVKRDLTAHVLADPYTAFQGLVFMKEEAAFLAAFEHGLTPRMDTVELEPMLQTVAQLIAGRGNIYSDSFGVAGPGRTTNARNIISYHSDLEAVVGNPGAIYAIAYNYAKNAGKKMFAEVNQGMHPDGARIHIGAHDISDTHYMIVCSDNGSPVCLDGFLNEVRKMYKEDAAAADQTISAFSPRAASVFRDWSTGQNFAIHELTVEDLTELVHTGNITGIGQTYASGSGIGLKSVRYFSEVHHGKPLYTQAFETGGPVFGVVLPKDATKARPGDLPGAVAAAKVKTDYRIAA
ncbi:MAG: hypothetical protein OXR66_09265 [Candidatus Woesearchaeota archaeon]|nr:hypothetical protein [Candidatus Woesearchaeota archaeon]